MNIKTRVEKLESKRESGIIDIPARLDRLRQDRRRKAKQARNMETLGGANQPGD